MGLSLKTPCPVAIYHQLTFAATLALLSHNEQLPLPLRFWAKKIVGLKSPVDVNNTVDRLFLLERI